LTLVSFINLKFITRKLCLPNKSSHSGFIIDTYSEADSTIETSLQIKTLTTQTEVCQAIVDKLGAFFSGSRANALEKTDLYIFVLSFLTQICKYKN